MRRAKTTSDAAQRCAETMLAGAAVALWIAALAGFYLVSRSTFDRIVDAFFMGFER